MPKTEVVFYQDGDGKAPVYEWLRELRSQNVRGWARCRARIAQLASSGYELRRPASDYLSDNIRELRAKDGHTQYRILYFFHGRNVAILTHAIVKKASVVDRNEIMRAVERMNNFKNNPEAHTFTGEVKNGQD